MGLTRFPNGLTVNSTTALAYSASAGDGDLDCNRLFVAGVSSLAGNLIVGGTLAFSTSGNTPVGGVVSLAAYFTTASTAQTISVPAPFTGQIISAFMSIGATSARAAGYTVQVGSAGSVAVATVSNTITDAYAGQPLTTTITGVTTANGIQMVRGVQGTTGDTTMVILVQRIS